MNQKVLRLLIAVLALGDGLLHLSLDFILFRGNLFGSGFPGGPRPGGAPPGGGPPPSGPGPLPLPLPLNQLFLLNFVGAVVLSAFFWLSPRLLGNKSWLANIVLILYEATTFAGWWLFGKPNPMNLGYLSKGIEIVLIAALAVGIWQTMSSHNSPSPSPKR